MQPVSPSRRNGQAFLPVAGIAGTLLMLGLVAGLSDSRHSLEVSRRNQVALEAKRHAALVERFGAEAPAVSPVAFARGKAYFEQSCAACHGQDGRGVAVVGGKDLVGSAFVTGHDDAALVKFIGEGRDPSDPLNTTQMPMPARGGNDGLHDEDLADIVTYLRGLQDPRRMPEGPLPRVALRDEEEPAAPEASAATVASAGEPAQALAAAAAPPGNAAVVLDPEAVKRGKRAYLSCMACHGRDGTGVKGVGKDLINSLFVQQTSDEELADFIKVGRGPSDPGNTTGIAMPPKGGNPALKDAQIKDIVTYIRSLQQAATAKADASM